MCAPSLRHRSAAVLAVLVTVLTSCASTAAHTAPAPPPTRQPPTRPVLAPSTATHRLDGPDPASDPGGTPAPTPSLQLAPDAFAHTQPTTEPGPPGGERGAAQADPSGPPVAPHPLESVVITTPASHSPASRDADSPIEADDAASLACAAVEAALDAAIAGDSDSLDTALSTAARWAARAGLVELRDLAVDLADRRADAIDALIVEALTACAAVGYEL